MFRNKSSSNVPNNTARNRRFGSFDSFSIVSLITFNNKLKFSRDLNIFMVSLFEIINNVVLEPKPLVCILGSGGAAAAVIINSTETLLGNV